MAVDAVIRGIVLIDTGPGKGGQRDSSWGALQVKVGGVLKYFGLGTGAACLTRADMVDSSLS